MAELLSPGAPGNFVDPATATPEQVAMQRLYAKALLEQSIKPEATHWTGALAQGLMGIRGQQQLNQATALQQAGIRSATQQDPNLAMLSSRGLLSPQGDLKSSILQQESGNNPNIRPSVSGAVGPGQIMPNTFASVARPGESINNPDDNRAVSGRLLDSYMEKYGDPARAAVAYFSGPGNVAPPGSPTPWLHDRKDPSGKSVSSYVSDVVGRMRGQPSMNMAQNYTAYQHNPWANPKEQDLARGMVTPTPGADVYGQPTVTSPMGGQVGLPYGRGAQPGYHGTITTTPEGGVSVPTQVLPPGATNPQPMAQQVQQALDISRQAGQQGAVGTGIRQQVGEDVRNAAGAGQVVQQLNLMQDLIKVHGDKIPFGPTADWVTGLKSSLAQHAPTFLSKADIEGLAATNEVNKITAQLATSIGRSTGNTDLSLLQGRQTVPGTHNTKEGNLAIIDMLKQTTNLNAQFVMQNQNKVGKIDPATGQPFNYLEAKNQFFRDNPIINPATGNPIRTDLKQGGGNQTKVLNGKVYTKIGDTWHEGM